MSGWDDSQRLEIGSPRQLSRGSTICPSTTTATFSSPTDDAGDPGAGLLDALEQWRDTGWDATSESHVPEHRAIDANRDTVERTKGALMRRYGMDTFQAFSLMVRWARQTHTPVHTLARTLAQGVDEADPHPERTTPPDRRPIPVA